jgi:hypothetical protein
MTFGKRVDGPGGRRRAVRNAVSLRAQLITPTESFEVSLIDVSSTGAKLHGPKIPRVGQLVMVRFGSLEAFGVVVWCDHQICGVNFNLPTNDDENQTLTELMDVFRRSIGPCAPRG